MKISTSSWHYKVCTLMIRSAPSDFCAYVRQFLSSVATVFLIVAVAAVVVASIFTVLVAFLPGFYIDTKNSFLFLLGVALLGVSAITSSIWIFVENIMPFFSKVKAAHKPGEFEQYISGKLCPIIEFTSEEKP